MIPIRTPRGLERTVVVLAPRKGWSLASLFTEYVRERYGTPDDPEEIKAQHLHLIVDARGWSYLDVVDFRQRLPSLQDAGKVGLISLDYNGPLNWTSEQLQHEIKRTMRTLEDPERQFRDQDGSLLVNACVVDLIIQLNEQLLQTQVRLEEAEKLSQNPY